MQWQGIDVGRLIITRVTLKENQPDRRLTYGERSIFSFEFSMLRLDGATATPGRLFPICLGQLQPSTRPRSRIGETSGPVHVREGSDIMPRAVNTPIKDRTPKKNQALSGSNKS